MKDRIYWILILVGFLLEAFGFAFVVLDVYKRHALAGQGVLYYGSSALLLYAVMIIVGMAIVIIAERRRKRS